MDFSTLTARGGIIKTVRAFFDGRGYLETLTPALSPDLIPETCLEAFETTLLPPPGSKTIKPQKLYLTPSPEIWMKKIIAEHRVSIYQICSSFRNCESESPVHSPEFLMLEYYTMNADYIDSLVLTEALFTALIETNKTALLRFQTEGELAAVSPPFIRLSMEEAFVRYAGFSLASAIERGTLRQEAEHLGMNIAPQFS
ncbi:MAG: LysR family transcriptional regulator, partial [Spirochaetaceae bacterium]|nr:LysR family transcriptional regulator [Spirochaetaceae bacterium]